LNIHEDHTQGIANKKCSNFILGLNMFLVPIDIQLFRFNPF